MKKKIYKKHKNPNTPTNKENLLSYIWTGSLEIIKSLENPVVQSGLQNSSESDLRKIAILVDKLNITIENAKPKFKYYGEPAGLK